MCRSARLPSRFPVALLRQQLERQLDRLRALVESNPRHHGRRMGRRQGLGRRHRLHGDGSGQASQGQRALPHLWRGLDGGGQMCALAGMGATELEAGEPRCELGRCVEHHGSPAALCRRRRRSAAACSPTPCPPLVGAPAVRPCGHEVCLPCCNRMRQDIVFKVSPPAQPAALLLARSLVGARQPAPVPRLGCLWQAGCWAACPTRPAGGRGHEVPLLQGVCRRVHRHGWVRCACAAPACPVPHRLAAATCLAFNGRCSRCWLCEGGPAASTAVLISHASRSGCNLPLPPARRANTIHDLVEANRAAHKSRVARKTGQADRAVSTSVRCAAWRQWALGWAGHCRGGCPCTAAGRCRSLQEGCGHGCLEPAARLLGPPVRRTAPPACCRCQTRSAWCRPSAARLRRRHQWTRSGRAHTAAT